MKSENEKTTVSSIWIELTDKHTWPDWRGHIASTAADLTGKHVCLQQCWPSDLKSQYFNYCSVEGKGLRHLGLDLGIGNVACWQIAKATKNKSKIKHIFGTLEITLCLLRTGYHTCT